MFIFNQQPGAKIDIRCPKTLLCLENCFLLKISLHKVKRLHFFLRQRDNSTDRVPSECHHTDLKKFSVLKLPRSSLYIRPKSDSKI